MREGYHGVAFCPACQCRVWLIRTKDGRIRCEWCNARDERNEPPTPPPASVSPTVLQAHEKESIR